jgi:hypothetical protein
VQLTAVLWDSSPPAVVGSICLCKRSARLPPAALCEASDCLGPRKAGWIRMPSSHDVLGDLRDRPISHDSCVASDFIFCAFISVLFSLLSACTFCLLPFRSPSCFDFALPRSVFRAAIGMHSYACLNCRIRMPPN